MQYKKFLSITLTVTTLVWSFGVPLGILFVPDTAQAATSVVISNGTLNGGFPGAPIGASSAATAVMKISATTALASKALGAVTVNFSGAGFIATDLAAITTSATSGVALYKDHTTLGTIGSFDSNDTVVTLAASPDWIPSTTTITLTPANPATDTVLATGSATIFYIVIKTSGTVGNDDQIIPTIPVNGVVTTDGNGPTDQFTANLLIAHTAAPTIVSVTGVVGQATVTVKFSHPVQKVGGGNLAFVGSGDPFTFADNGTTGGSTFTIAHTAGQDFATITFTNGNTDSGDFDGSPSTIAAGTSKIADMAGNAIVAATVSFSSPLQITTAVVPGTTVGAVTNSATPLVTFAAAGGTTAYKWRTNSAADTGILTSLGLSNITDAADNTDGKLFGTILPVPGSHTFTLKVTDSAQTPAVVTKIFTINVAATAGAGIPGITNVSPPGGAQNTANLSVVITGANTAFSSSSVVTFPNAQGVTGTNGITVGAITATSATSLAVTITTIATDAVAGGRDVKVVTGTQTVTMPNGFNVFAGGATGLTLLVPAASATNVQIPPTFSFNPSSNTSVNSYRVTVKPTSDFSGTASWDYVFPKPADSQNTNGSHCASSNCTVNYGAGIFRAITVTPAPLSPNTTYYWQVQTFSETMANVNVTTSLLLEATAVRSFTTTASVTDTMPPTIQHRPVFQATASTDLVLFARVVDDKATKDTNPALTTTILYCAGASCTPTTSANGSFVGSGYFSYTIPSATISTANTIVRYYLQATDATNTFSMYSSGTTPFSLTSVAAGASSIAGTVKDSANACPAAVQSARVFAEGTGFTATTDASCAFTISGITAGVYDLAAAKDTYADGHIMGIAAGATAIPFKLTQGGAGGFGGDTTKPGVKFTMPGPDMTNMPGGDSNIKIAVVFNKAMSQNSVLATGNLTVNDVNTATGVLTDITATKGSWTYYVTAPTGSALAGLPPEANMAAWSLSGTNTLGDNKTIAVIVSSGVTDTAGNSIQGNNPDGSYAFQFSTSGATFTGTFGTGQFGSGAFVPPHVNGTTPPPGASAVPTNTSVVINFSDPMADDTGTYVLKNFVKLFTVSGAAETDVTSSALNTVTLDTAKLSAKITLKNTFNSGAFATGTKHRVKVLGGAKGANGMLIAPPGQTETSVFYTSEFTTGTGSDVAAPSVVGSYPDNLATSVPVNVGAISVGLSKDMDSTTISTSTITLTVGSTTVNGAVEYRTLERQAFFTPKTALTPNTTYTLTITPGVKGLNGTALASAVTRTFTTGGADSIVPAISFINADDFGFAITFSEPVNAAKATDALNWPTSVLNPATYDVIKYGTAGFNPASAGTVIPLTGTTLSYDAPSNTVMIEGLAGASYISQEVYISMDTTGSNAAKDLSGNVITSTGSTGRVTVANSATTKGALGPMAMSTDSFSSGGTFVPTHFSSTTFGFVPPVMVMPKNMMAGQTTSYMVMVPISKQIAANGEIVLTFPTGFDVTSAQQDINSPMRTDVNGPGTGTPTFKCTTNVVGGKSCAGGATVTGDTSGAGDAATRGALDDDGVVVNTPARSITITLSAATNSAGHDFLNLDISGIKNSTVPKDFNTAGYTVDVKTKSGATVLESLTSMPIFLQQAGTNALTGTITAAGATSGTMKIYLMSPMTGPLEATSGAFSSGAATYTFSNLPNGEYMLYTDQTISLSAAFVGKTTPERVSVSGNTTYNFSIVSDSTGTAVTLSIDGPNAELLDIFASSPTGFKSKSVTLDSNPGAQNVTLNLADGTWWIGVGPPMPKGPMAGAPPQPTYIMPKPIEIKVTGPSTFVENSGTANDGTLVFTLSNAGKQIRGKVQDGSGKILADAEVYAYDPQGGFGTHATTDTTGAFTLNVVDGSYTVGSFVPGMPHSKEVSVIVTSHATQYLLIDAATATITPAAAATSFVLKVAKPDFTISGKVTDGTNVVQGASVFAYRTDGQGFANANTDAAGAYTLYVANGAWKVGVFLPLYGNLGEQSVTVAGASVANTNFSPSQTGSFFAVSGRVYQDITVGGGFAGSDVAIQGAFVRITGNNTFNEAITGADGKYSVNVPSGNGYIIKASAPSIGELPALAAFNVTAATIDKDVVVTAPRTITITLSASVAEAFVSLFSGTGVGGHTSIRNTTIGTLSLPDGSYSVNVHIPGVAIGIGDVSGNTDYSSATGILTVNGNEALTVTIPTLRTVSGTVTDGTNPVADAWMEIFNSATGTHAGTKSAANGTFSLKVPNSTTVYKVNAMKPGYFRDATSLTVSAAVLDTALTGLTIPMAASTLSIAGQVLIGTSGVANAFVRAEKQGGGFAGAQTDTSGTYSIGVTSGTWKVFAVSAGFAETAAATLVDTTGGSATGVNITLSTTFALDPPKSQSMTPASGGTVEDATAGIKITIPAGSLCDPTKCAANSAGNVQAKETNGVRTTSTGKPIGGKGQEITAIDSAKKPLTTLASDITIEMTLTLAELAAAASPTDSSINTLAEADTLQLAYWDTSLDNWVRESSTVTYKNSLGTVITDSTTIDTATEFAATVATVAISALTDHLSLYAPMSSTGASPPSTPAGLGATGASTTQINLSWTAVTSDPPATGYSIYRSTSSGGTFTRLGSEPTVSSGSTVTYADGAGLSASTTYFYKISALNGSSESGSSSAVSGATTGLSGGSYVAPSPAPRHSIATVLCRARLRFRVPVLHYLYARR